MKAIFCESFKELEQVIKDNPEQNLFAVIEPSSKFKYHIFRLKKS